VGLLIRLISCHVNFAALGGNDHQKHSKKNSLRRIFPLDKQHARTKLSNAARAGRGQAASVVREDEAVRLAMCVASSQEGAASHQRAIRSMFSEKKSRIVVVKRDALGVCQWKRASVFADGRCDAAAERDAKAF
jgi:hypothetical protein